MSLMTLGVGRYKDNDFLSLLVELADKKSQFNIPDNARYVRAPVGSTYAIEVIWIAND